jgi:dTDP-glucose 4,6-dehydratase
MKRLLITGAAGFIGGHVLEYFLRNTDWEIILVDRLDVSGTLHRVKQVIADVGGDSGSRVKFVWHDLKSPINEFVSKNIGKVHYVIHLAASSHVDRSIADPLSFIMDNVVGTTNLLIWAKEGGMYQGRLLADPRAFMHEDIQEPEGMFINFSTDEVFGPAAVGYAHKEDDPHRPSNAYSASKSGQEAIGYAFYITHGLPVITTHTMNNFGQMQHPEKLVPSTIRNVINGTPQPIFAELNDKNELEGVGSRYWIHGKNTADALKFLLEKGKAGESYNIIGFDELTNLEIAQKVADIVGKPLIPKFVDFHKVRPGHDRRYALDGSKMRDMGWVPVVDFDGSLKETVEWTIAHPEWQ